MFIPKGKAIHENLATSYVLIDALVADLCEGGFTGVVEVVLRDTDSHVIISRGEVTASVETRLSEETENGGAGSLLQPAVADLAARARQERGRVSVYNYSLATSSAIAGRIHSQPLYARLSSEFADLERMLSKLGREPDRQWFVEIDSASGLCGLIHLNGDRCVVMTSDGERPEAEINSVDLLQNAELRSLVDEFSRSGGTFDVYYKSLDDSEREVSPSEHQWIEPPGLARESLNTHAPSTFGQEHAESDPQDEVARAVMEAKAAFQLLSVEEPSLGLNEEAEPEVKSPRDPVQESPEELEKARFAVLGLAREPELEEGPGEASKQDSPAETQDALFGSGPAEATAPGNREVPRADDDLLLVRDDFKAAADLQQASEDEVMAEVKRLMAEIARTVEDAIESVEHQSTFPIHLRAGQLKVADRYPFLDPFGPEFEYLAGEIAFVGHVKPGEFVEGLTKALKLAVDGVAQASAQPSRVRGGVSDALRWLLSRQQTELEAYGLDESIREILNG
ncbi:MAG: hypothetical protein WAU45_16040 [Blastocatellia bacterium]